jgi:aminoglycoside phosphotransferase (APT) family kinase protein
LKTSRFSLRPTSTRGFLSQTFFASRAGDSRNYVLKVGPEIPERRKWARELRVFAREVAAYRLLAPLRGKYSPKMYAGTSAHRGANGLLLIEEIRGATCRDQMIGLTLPELASVARTIARLHAKFWNSPLLRRADGLPFHRYMRAHEVRRHLPSFLRWTRRSVQERHFFKQLPQRVSLALAHFRKRPATLVHGDLRSDNIYFGRTSIRFIDWGLALAGHGTFDLARLIGGSARTPLTLAQQITIFEVWHRSLVRSGISNYPRQKAWQDYHHAVALTLTIPITNAPTLARFSSRGQKLAQLITKRFLRSARELTASSCSILQ